MSDMNNALARIVELEKEVKITHENIFTANNGYTILNQNVFKQGKHYFGNLVIQKTSGYFTSSEANVLNINIAPCKDINTFCALSDNRWKSRAIGQVFISKLEKNLLITDSNNSNYNFAKINIDIVVD